MSKPFFLSLNALRNAAMGQDGREDLNALLYHFDRVEVAMRCAKLVEGSYGLEKPENILDPYKTGIHYRQDWCWTGDTQKFWPKRTRARKRTGTG